MPDIESELQNTRKLILGLGTEDRGKTKLELGLNCEEANSRHFLLID